MGFIMHPYMLTRRQNLHWKKGAPADAPSWILLALEAQGLTDQILDMAFDRCSRQASRVHVLAANPSGSKLTMLHEFIGRLERQGIEYRLTATAGVLCAKVARYLQRNPGIKTVLTDQLGHWPEEEMQAMQRLLGANHNIVSLAEAQAHAHQ